VLAKESGRLRLLAFAHMTKHFGEPNTTVVDGLVAKFKDLFGEAPAIVSYAPGRVEVLGNHTDYNEGYVLSAAIQTGTFFLLAPAAQSELVPTIRIHSGSFGQVCELPVADIIQEAAGTIVHPSPLEWANYIKGVLIGLVRAGGPALNVVSFNAFFDGNLPMGLGLSSSAALEISAGLAIQRHFGLNLTKKELAKVGQLSEHQYVGVKCGLLDQFSSLYGEAHKLVLCDFRTLEVQTVDLGPDACFLICNTKVRHRLVASEFNERAASCHLAAETFAHELSPKPVKALRDVTMQELQHSPMLVNNPTMAKRAAHPIGENERVLKAKGFLAEGHLQKFGQLMFESHESSQIYFENSCPELDVVVACARRNPKVLGARLSGGGFGGAAVLLINRADADEVEEYMLRTYAEAAGKPCEIYVIIPSDGGRLLHG